MKRGFQIWAQIAIKFLFGDKTRENRDALFKLGFLGHCLWRLEPGLGRAGHPELGGEKEKDTRYLPSCYELDRTFEFDTITGSYATFKGFWHPCTCYNYKNRYFSPLKS